MRQILVLIIIMILATDVFSQLPDNISYQVVIRNTDNVLAVKRTVGLKISILKSGPNGEAVYIETQKANTNANGLVSIQLGAGNVLKGNFSTINWAVSNYYIKVEADINGGEQYAEQYRTSNDGQLLSVPYALHAKTAETGKIIQGNIQEDDPIFTAWDKKTGITISKSQITNLGNIVETETDPTFSDWNKTDNINIYKNQITDLGSHLENESDPIFAAWDKDYKDFSDTPDITAIIQKVEMLEQLLGVGRFTDSRDGTSYATIRIGNQVWMAENLKFLPSVVGPGTQSATQSYYYVYGYDGTNVDEAKGKSTYQTYGVLYNKAAAMRGAPGSNTNPSGVQGICPAGWHLPSKAEWEELIYLLGGSSVAGGKLKEKGFEHWNSQNTSATDEVHFTALPGGRMSQSGSFYGLSQIGRWMTSSDADDITIMNSENPYIEFNQEDEAKTYVRCVKD